MANGRRILDRHGALRVVLVFVTLGALLLAARTFAPDAAAGVRLVTERLGIAGFACYLLWSLAVFVPCGAAWWVTTGEPRRRLGLFVWARLVREATADLLPFSQVGGVVLGAAVVVARGIAPARAYASFVVDLMTELASQLLFTACGVAALWSAMGAQDLRALPLAAIVAGLVATAGLLAALVAAPTTLSFAQHVARRIVPSTARTIADGVACLRTIYARPSRVFAAFGFNLVAWFASAAGAALVLHLVAVPVATARVMALETLIFLLRSTAFAIPAGLGVQEAAYGLLGPILGLPPEGVVALALVKRMRDLCIAVPVLAIWQLRALPGRGRSSATSACD